MTNKIIENIQVKSLAQVPELIPILAQWTYDAWGKYDPSLSIEGTIRNLQSKIIPEKNIPVVFIAFYNNLPIATITLKEKIPVPGYEDRDIWLGSFIVQEGYQNQGVGSFMQEYAFSKAKEFGYSKISLFASDIKAAEWYADNGWNLFANDIYQGHPVKLLEHILL